MLNLTVIITSSPLLKANPNPDPNRLDDNCVRRLSTDFLLNSAGSWEESHQCTGFHQIFGGSKFKEMSPEETSAWLRVKKLIILQKSNHTCKTTQQSCIQAFMRSSKPTVLVSQLCPFQSAHYHYLDHLLADSHERVVQFWIHHFCLLQFKHFLVAAGAQLLLDFFQAFNNLQHSITTTTDTLLIWFCHTLLKTQSYVFP